MRLGTRHVLAATLLCSCFVVELPSQHLPVGEATNTYFYGRLRLGNGQPPPDFAAIELLCLGRAFVTGFTDTEGRFALLLQRGGPTFLNGQGIPALTRDQLAHCELRVSLPGFRSGRISLRAAALRPDIGTVVISPSGKASANEGEEPALTPEVGKAWRKAAEALGNSKWDKARDGFQKVLSARRDSPRVWLALGMAEEGARDYSAALESYGKAVSMSPGYRAAYVRFASLASRLGEWDQAAQYSETALGLDPKGTPEAYALCALSNLKLKKLEVAESSARQGLRVDGFDDYPELHLVLAQTLAGRGAITECQSQLDQYLALVPDDAEAAEARKRIGVASKVGNKTR